MNNSSSLLCYLAYLLFNFKRLRQFFDTNTGFWIFCLNYIEFLNNFFSKMVQENLAIKCNQSNLNIHPKMFAARHFFTFSARGWARHGYILPRYILPFCFQNLNSRDYNVDSLPNCFLPFAMVFLHVFPSACSLGCF